MKPMSDLRPTPYADRLLEPPSKLEWLLIAIVEAIVAVGVLTGVLGVAWLVVTPTVIAASVHFLCKAFERPQAAGAR
jgi:hypothetical protein